MIYFTVLIYYCITITIYLHLLYCNKYNTNYIDHLPQNSKHFQFQEWPETRTDVVECHM